MMCQKLCVSFDRLHVHGTITIEGFAKEATTVGACINIIQRVEATGESKESNQDCYLAEITCLVYVGQ
jgi:hypothetical protein